MRHVSVAELKENADELADAADAGEQLVVTLSDRDFRLIPARPVLSPERRQAMEDADAFRQRLRDRGVRVTAADIRDWIVEGRP